MSRGVICLDAGHGGSDPGAEGPGGVEKDYTLLQAHVCASILHIHNIDPILTRLADKYIALTERANIANNASARAFISFHFNASVSEEPSGTQVLFWGDDERAEELAEILIDRIAPLDGQEDERWEKIIAVPQPHFRNGMRPTVLEQTRMPGVILETEFGTNPNDAELLFDPTYIVSIAQAVGQSLECWL